MSLVQLTRNAKSYWQWQQTIVERLQDDFTNDAEGFLELDPEINTCFQRALESVKESEQAFYAFFASLVKKEKEWIGILTDLRDELRGNMNPDQKS